MGEQLITLKPCIICSRLGVSEEDDADQEGGGSSRILKGRRDQEEQHLLKRFLRLLGRCLNLEQETTDDGVVVTPMWMFQFEKLISAGMLSCAECSKVVEAFCQLYEQFKSLELRLNWKLGVLQDLMSAGEKEPARMKDFRESAKRLGMVPEETIDFVVNFKKDLIGKCDWEMQATFPRLRLRRHPQPVSEESIPQGEDFDTSGLDFDHGSPLDDQSGAESESETDKKVFRKEGVVRASASSSASRMVARLEDPDSDYVADSDMDSEGSEGPHSPARMEKKRVGNDPANSVEAKSQEEKVPQVLPCKICGKEYTKPVSLRGHMRRVHPKPKGATSDKDEDFPYEIIPQSTASKPQPIFDAEDESYKCDRCPKSFDERRQWLKHYKKCHLVRFKCTLCDKQFPSKYDCKRHQLNAHKGVTFDCSKCSKRFTSKHTLAKHQRMNKCKMGGPPKPTKPKCSYCQKEFTQPGYLRQHVKMVHLKVRDHICTHCGKGFSENSILKKHLMGVHREGGTHYEIPRRHKKHMEDVPEPGVTWVANELENDSTSSAIPVASGGGEGPPPPDQVWEPPPLVFNSETGMYKCDHCPLEFKFPQNFHRHYWKISHRPIHTCLVCLKQFKKRNLYTCHYQAAHMTPRFPCEKCNKIFTRRESLRAHLRITGCGGAEEGPPVRHECPTCGKLCPSNGALQRHVNSVHLKLRDHLCNECGKGFPFPGDLRKHVARMHNEGEEHLCDLCGKGFKAEVNLRRHVRAMHRGNLNV